MKTTTIELLSSRGHEHRSGSPAKAPSASKRRPAQSTLSQDELLAKIDALDWDETVTHDATAPVDGKASGQYPDHSTSTWRVAAIVVLVAGMLTGLYFVLAPGSASRPVSDQPPTAAGAGSPATPGAVGNSVPAPDSSAAAVAAAEERRAALYAQAVRDADMKAQRSAERQRKAHEAERAVLAAQQERERRVQEEEARLRAEREADEAARARAREQAAQPKGPASPQELCANEGGAIARGFCEARACGKAEWRSHPFCVKRMDDQLRAIGQGGG